MNIESRQQLIRDCIKACLDFVDEEVDLPFKHHFIGKFETKFNHGEGSWGGVDRSFGVIWPTVKISVHDRDFDHGPWLESIRQRPWLATGRKSWRDCYQLALENQWLYTEYSSIHYREDIGSFISDDSGLHVMATVCHEVAHAIHWWLVRHDLCSDTKPHGNTWRELYAKLRNHFVNPYIDSCESRGMTMAAKVAAEKEKTMSTKKPASKKKRKSKKTPAKKSAKRTSGAVQKVWDICEKNKADIKSGKKTRKDVIEACVKAGINKGTASTQYQAWKVNTLG